MAFIVLFFALLPALASSKTAPFTPCVDGVGTSDPLMLTQEGIDIINTWSDLKLVAWGRDVEDDVTSCHSLSIADNYLTLKYKINGEDAEASGPLDIVHVNGRNNYITLDTRKGVKMPYQTFGAARDGKIRMYVHYLGENELGLLTCRDGWLGSDYYYYVFSTVDYSSFDQDCILETAERLDNFNMQLAPTCS